MGSTRGFHTSVRLNTGKVLAIGGYNSTYLASCELYDSSTGLWTSTDSLNNAREYHNSVLLANGNVITINGFGSSVLSSCELYVALLPLLLNLSDSVTLGEWFKSDVSFSGWTNTDGPNPI
jgi:hypothetical protein